DIYYQRMAEATTGIVAVFCRAYRRPFVFALAHNYNCKPDLPALPRRRDKWLYRYGLRHADAVISQTRFQQHMLRKHFDVESVVIPNCGLDLANAAQEAEDKANQPTKRVLWIGRFSREKRLDILLDVAERCPDVQFDVVGDTDGKQPAMDALKAQAQHISHIRLHGLVPHSKIACFYHKAHLLLCTSDDEGFPNTFIEAWSCGVPVVTTFDPDGVVARCTAGAVAADASGLVSSMRDLLQSQHWRESSQRARHLFDQHHTIGQVTQHIEQLILSLAR
ncbi:MAG: glycosyltransferase family 4 protein, partial [Rhodopirellula sp.]|nr:glycosyltransferase family 4 protein [Rhodopirellula sp.]